MKIKANYFVLTESQDFFFFFLNNSEHILSGLADPAFFVDWETLIAVQILENCIVLSELREF